ncbi:MAG TPA: DUF1697 domain-containing protein [Allosphingosinicella sp.]|nr:DUF1697 domain-containing protein [Allosphingosinicella sp.]
MVALLGGINVGGHRKVPMAELRALAEAIGLEDPRTYVASGNLVFASKRPPATLEAKLEEALHKRFGFKVDVLVRTAAQWRGYAEGNPLPDEAKGKPNWLMLLIGKRDATDADVAALSAKASANEKVVRSDDALWLYYGDGAARSKLGGGAGKEFWTARNHNTVLKLNEMLEA